MAAKKKAKAKRRPASQRPSSMYDVAHIYFDKNGKAFGRAKAVLKKEAAARGLTPKSLGLGNLFKEAFQNQFGVDMELPEFE